MKQNKVELLSPCGSKEALIAAVQAGCDAVYLGGKQFGARAFASNFTDEEMIDAIKYAHLHDVSVYVTVNTIIFESEMEELQSYLEFLYNNQVDAVIVQDFGVVKIIKERFPDFEIHASTQMHVHNKAGALFLKNAGFDRVVVARETSLKVLKEIISVGIDVEVFVHGALCFCYSGQCNMSRVIGNRSGNRGSCAQPCRLPYQLLRNDELVDTAGSHLLSPKDLCLDDKISLLKEIGVHSLKIEGRMKKAEYVFHITSFYHYLLNSDVIEEKTVNQYLKKAAYLFSRGYTKGYLLNETIGLSQKQPNHQGVHLGKIINQNGSKVSVELLDDIHVGDGVRFVSNSDGFMIQKLLKDGREVMSAMQGEIIELFYAHQIEIGSYILKTLNAVLEKEIQECFQRENKKKGIRLSFEASVDKRAVLQIVCDNHCVEVSSNQVVDLAQKQSTSKERIQEQLTKLGGTVYQIETLDLKVEENIFIPISELNQMRREALLQVDNLRTNKYPFRQLKPAKKISSKQKKIEIPYLVEVNTAQQYQVCKDFGLEHIVYNNNESAIMLYPQVNENSEYPSCDSVIIQELGGFLQEAGIKIAGVSMNLVNLASIQFLSEYGCNAVVLSNELPQKDKQELMKRHLSSGSEVILFEQIYGYQTVMISKHCVIQSIYQSEKGKCTLCHNAHFCLEDRKKARYVLKGDENCHMQIYSSQAIFNRKNIGICRPYLRFTIEDVSETREILKQLKDVLQES